MEKTKEQLLIEIKEKISELQEYINSDICNSCKKASLDLIEHIKQLEQSYECH